MKRDKRSACVTVRMTRKEFQTVRDAARKRWPGLEGIVSKSDVLRCFALIGSEARKCKKKS
jgi:hypothetical protein